MYDDTVMVDKAYYNKLKEQTTWISVDDRLPEYGRRVLVVNCIMVSKDKKYTMYSVGVTIRQPNLKFTFWGHPITHWMPLPEPPESEE